MCLAYEDDLNQVYSFYCARYQNLSFSEFLNLGISEFNRKISSIPKTEPLYERIQSRIINVAKIKDKDERKKWKTLKKINRIPQIYLSIEEIDKNLKEEISSGIKKIQ